MAGFSRRVFFSGAVLFGVAARGWARNQYQGAPPLKASGVVGDWGWHAKEDSVLLNHDAVGADDLSAILSFGVLSHKSFGQDGKSVPNDRTVCIHYLVSAAGSPGTVTSVAWDGRPATEVRDKPPYAISGGMNAVFTLHQVFVQEVDLDRLVKEAHRSIVYGIVKPDGTHATRRLDARNLGSSLGAGYQAMTRLNAPVASANTGSDAVAHDAADEIELVSSPSAESYYPSRSAALGESGRAVVRCTLDAEGVPQRCVVAQSSGFPRLDSASIAFTQAGRYRARSGGPIAGVTFFRPVRWALN